MAWVYKFCGVMLVAVLLAACNGSTDSPSGTEAAAAGANQELDSADADSGQVELAVAGVSIYSADNTELCLTLADTALAQSASAIILSACQDSSSQRWWMDESGRIHSQSDLNYCIGVDVLDYFAKPVARPCGAGLNQNWQVSQQALRQGDWALDFDHSNNSVILYSYHGNTNQQWLGLAATASPTPADDSEPETTTPPPASSTPDPLSGELLPSSPWTFLQAPASGAYGSRSFAVPAAQNWVNSGLYLKAGESAEISAQGEWSVTGGTLHGAAGSGSKTQRGCVIGALSARIGLAYEDSAITCIGNGGRISAVRDGILFLGAIVSTDLGETYETRKQALGELQVTVSSEGANVPTLFAADAAGYPFAGVSAGWVEVLGKHSILTLPTSIAAEDAAFIAAAVARLDAIYDQHATLRGRSPYHGQPIRWYADSENTPGWMLAGNPVRMDPALVYADNQDRITRAAQSGNNWGFAHEMGHDFNFAGGDWYYTSYGGLEAWPNIFSVHAIEQLGLPPRELNCASKKSAYLASGSYENNFSKDVWLALCFFMEFKDDYGWDFYQRFYQKFNASPGSGWGFLRTRFSAAAGKDVNAVFDEWKLPAN